MEEVYEGKDFSVPKQEEHILQWWIEVKAFETQLERTKHLPEYIFYDGNKWIVSIANSIKQVTNDVACLALVDGAVTSEHAIVIGAFQFEDNLLEFDLESSTLGFSSSLLRKKTSCAKFNFTLTD